MSGLDWIPTVTVTRMKRKRRFRCRSCRVCLVTGNPTFTFFQHRRRCRDAEFVEYKKRVVR